LLETHSTRIIRDAVVTDLDAIVGIYNSSIPGRLATADIEPVSTDSRRAWLLDRDPSRYPVWVIERDHQIIGWLSFNKFYGRAAYNATSEVSIYVDPKAQKAGVASQLLEHAFARAGSLGFETLLAFVFAHNEPSVALCRKFGFQQWGHLPRVAVLDGIERDLLILGKRLRD